MQGICPDSSSGRAPTLKVGDLGSNFGPSANFSLNILTSKLIRWIPVDIKFPSLINQVM